MQCHWGFVLKKRLGSKPMPGLGFLPLLLMCHGEKWSDCSPEKRGMGLNRALATLPQDSTY